MTLSNPLRLRILLSCYSAVLAMSASPAMAQTMLPASPTFDVVSIKTSNAEPDWSSSGLDGNVYEARNTPLWSVMVDAYLPDSHNNVTSEVANAPAWLWSERYDINAKLDGLTSAAFDHLTHEQQRQQIAPLLQKMLEDRLKLAVHLAPMQVDGEALVLDKGGPKFKEAQPGEELPQYIQEFPGGGKIARPRRQDLPIFFQMSMKQLANYFRQSGLFVEDRTGLTGTYDLSIARGDRSHLPQDADSKERIQTWGLQALGLKLVPAKVTVQKIVIDHIERPQPN